MMKTRIMIVMTTKLKLLILAAALFSASIGATCPADAASYTFSFKNNLNMFNYSNNPDAVCSVTAQLRTGSGVMATNTISSLKADKIDGFTLSSTICNLQKVIATCRFKDFTGKVKTETKETLTNCQGGTYYISPDPFASKSWTSFSINKY